MSTSFQSITLAYCLACLTSGAVRELLPEADSRKVIKAISGLYILLVILHGAGDIRAAGISFALPQEQPSASENTNYTDSVIDETKSRLESSCENQLASMGMTVKLDFALTERDGNVTVANIAVTSDGLSPEQKQEVQDVLRDYAPGKITFLSEADAA
jgi:hypothetical protein